MVSSQIEMTRLLNKHNPNLKGLVVFHTISILFNELKRNYYKVYVRNMYNIF